MENPVLNKLIVYVLIGLFLAIFVISMWGSEGLFNIVTKSALKAEEFVNMEPSSEVKATPPPDEAVKGRNAVLSNLIAANNSKKTNCLLAQSLEVSKLGDYAVEITNSGTGILFTLLDPKNKGAVRFPSQEQDNLKICSINPQSFYDCFLANNNPCQSSLGLSHFSKKPAYELSKETAMEYLIKTSTGEVCIFPMETTISPFCDARSTGLDDSCSSKIPTVLPKCSQIS